MNNVQPFIGTDIILNVFFTIICKVFILVSVSDFSTQFQSIPQLPLPGSLFGAHLKEAVFILLTAFNTEQLADTKKKPAILPSNNGHLT